MENRKRKRNKYFKNEKLKPFIITNITETGKSITIYEGEKEYKELKKIFDNLKKEYNHESEEYK